jgi:Oxidoreductase molybdopterin binding domain
MIIDMRPLVAYDGPLRVAGSGHISATLRGVALSLKSMNRDRGKQSSTRSMGEDLMRLKHVIYLRYSLVMALSLSGLSVQAGEPATSTLAAQVRIDGMVEQPLTFHTPDLATLPRRTLQVRDHNGRESVFEGVALVELLKRAGVPLGKDLRGNRMVTYVVVGAADGYRVVFALPEIDPAFSDRLILLADRRDQQPLSPQEGPLRLIVPGEKRQARWVRQVTAVTIRQAE